jgi:hypothetical protein
MLSRFFKRSAPGKASEFGPAEPIFPAEEIVAGRVQFDEGAGYVIINKAYDNYPNKKYFPWCIQITLEYREKNENGLPGDSEGLLLNEMEDRLEEFIKKSHQTHFVARVTRRDFRDIFYYVDHPHFDERETGEFLDEMNNLRNLNFRIDRDETWSFVSGLIE